MITNIRIKKMKRIFTKIGESYRIKKIKSTNSLWKYRKDLIRKSRKCSFIRRNSEKKQKEYKYKSQEIDLNYQDLKDQSDQTLFLF